jgi:hypothetical protein
LVNKQLLGQFYTTSDPFLGSDAFSLWNNLRPKDTKVLEPFAGSGLLYSYLNEDWIGYDIDPKLSTIIQQNTIQNFPTGFDVCITNPPYLAKTTISRQKLNTIVKYQDLYLDCLKLMLDNCKYIAAIIPSTFYNTKLFQNRLIAWDKLDREIFSDTDVPVGVAYFAPKSESLKIYVNGKEIKEYPPQSVKSNISFNVENGNYVLCAIDTTKGRNIHIHNDVKNFDRKKYLKHTSRNYSLFYSPKELNIDNVNSFIQMWRDETNDFYLTSFKSTMKTGIYRKRMNFNILKWIISMVDVPLMQVEHIL